MLASLLELLAANDDRRCMAIGDLNAGLPIDSTHEVPYFKPESRLPRLLESGWVDAYRHGNGDAREFSHWNNSRGNGFLLDHALVAPGLLDAVTGAVLVHEVAGIPLLSIPGDPRTRGAVSDHSALVVDLNVEVATAVA